MSTANYNALAGSLLTRGAAQPAGTPINTGQALTTDLNCQGEDELVVEVDMTGAANADLAVEVRPFQFDNTTVQINQIPPISSDGPDFVGGHVYYFARYDVTSVEKVRIQITNNNAGTQTLTRSNWRLAGG